MRRAVLSVLLLVLAMTGNALGQAAPKPFDWNAYAERPFTTPSPEAGSLQLFSSETVLADQHYTHYSFLLATPDGTLLAVSYEGDQHGMGQESSVVLRRSGDGGRTFSEGRAILEGRGQDLEWRIGASGVLPDGSVMVTALRLDRKTRDWTLGVITSTDQGQTWSAFRELNISPKNPSGRKGSQMITNARIIATPGGRLLMMSFLGAANYVMTSDDRGWNWQLRRIVSASKESTGIDYSEMAIAALDDDRYVTVARVDRQRSSMAQFVTEDGGDTWRDLGQLNLPVSGGYVMPSLDLVTWQGEPRLVLVATDRATGRSFLRTAGPDDALASARVWGPPRDFAWNMKVRSGYPSPLFDVKRNLGLAVNHRETGEFTTQLLLHRFPLDGAMRP